MAQCELGGTSVFQEANYGEIFEFCIEFHVGGPDVAYDVMPGLSSFSPTVQTQLAALFSNAAPVLAGIAGDYRKVTGGNDYLPGL